MPAHESVIEAARGVVAARTMDELRQAVTQLSYELAEFDASKPISIRPLEEEWWTPPPASEASMKNPSNRPKG
jgi:hypothetical protein